jgi:hypothetical protein
MEGTKMNSIIRKEPLKTYLDVQNALLILMHSIQRNTKHITSDSMLNSRYEAWYGYDKSKGIPESLQNTDSVLMKDIMATRRQERRKGELI